MNKDRDNDQVVYLGIAAVLFCLAAFFVLKGSAGPKPNTNATRVEGSSVSVMAQEVNGTVDDGGEADILQLKNQAKGL